MEKRRQPEIIAGRVNADGSIAAGDGFFTTSGGTGITQVILPSSFRSVSVMASPYNASAIQLTVDQITTNVFVVRTFQPAGSPGVAAAFTFVAVGVQQ